MRSLTLVLTVSLLQISCAERYMTVPKDYHGQLEALRERCEVYETNAPRFFLFGMGNRTKYIYKDHLLRNLDSDETFNDFKSVVSDSIVPDNYTVVIMRNDNVMRIVEDEYGVHVVGPHSEYLLEGTSSHITLPEFEDFVYDKVLKVLHHELLINIRNSIAYPNIFVYNRPFYRDAFMATLCLEKTGNTNLLMDWITNIHQLYDMANGQAEADNLGELLYLSSVAGIDEELLLRLLTEIRLQTMDDGEHKFLVGITDGVPNSEYATQILKLALAKSGLSDNYTSSPTPGIYKDLCWFKNMQPGQRETTWRPTELIRDERDFPYPYPQWARAHYYDDFKAPMSATDYPLSWEAFASQAHYEGMAVISSKAVKQNICYPHLWAAAEMFLKLYQYKR